MDRKGVVPQLPGLSRSSPLMRTVQRRRRSRLVRWLRLLLPLVPGGPAWHRLLWAFGGLLLTLGFGVLGYHLIDDFAPFDALYQTALTITTVGFQEVHPLSRGARLFTIFLSLFGVATALYLLAAVGALLLEGDLYRDLYRWRIERMIERLERHIVVAGAGRVGRGVADELQRLGVEFVIVDNDDEVVEEARLRSWPVMKGAAGDRDVLEQVGLERAEALIVTTGDDAQNTFITLTALGIAPQLRIVVRCNQPQSIPQMQQAGATEVFSPTEIAGRYMANAAASGNGGGAGGGQTLIKLNLDANAPAVGMTVQELRRQSAGLHLLGLEDGDGRVLSPVPARHVVAAGDALLLYGSEAAVAALGQAGAVGKA